MGRGLSPPSGRSCPAHMKKTRLLSGAGLRVVQLSRITCSRRWRHGPGCLQHRRANFYPESYRLWRGGSKCAALMRIAGGGFLPITPARADIRSGVAVGRCRPLPSGVSQQQGEETPQPVLGVGRGVAADRRHSQLCGGPPAILRLCSTLCVSQDRCSRRACVRPPLDDGGGACRTHPLMPV